MGLGRRHLFIQLFFFVLVFLTLFVGQRAAASLRQKHPRLLEGLPKYQIEEIFIRTLDGADLKIQHLKSPGEPSNPNRPIFVNIPGLGAQGLSLVRPGSFWKSQGYDVFLANWRGSAKLPEGMSPFGSRNGLPELATYDFRAIIDYLVNHYATAEQKTQGISILGHSMGGIMTMGGLSLDETYKEFRPYIRGIVLFQSPHHLAYLKWYMKYVAQVAIPMLNKLKAEGWTAIDHHSKLLRHSKETKLKGGFQGRVLMPSIENLSIFLVHFAAGPEHTGRQTVREAFLKISAESIPIDLLLDFAHTVLKDGQFVFDGKPLIEPSKVKDIPILVVSTRKDSLAPRAEQLEYFQKLDTVKQFLDVDDMAHLAPLLFTRREADFYPFVSSFLANPNAAARTPMLTFNPNADSFAVKFGMKCESILLGAKGRFFNK